MINKSHIAIAAGLFILTGNTYAANATTAQLAVETAARKAADVTEKSERLAADNAQKTALSNEIMARIAADTAETTARQAADNAEASARTSAIQAAVAPLLANSLPPLPATRFQATLTLCGNSDTPQWGVCHYAIGDTGPAGGIVFFISDNGMHGLEASPVDQGIAPWGCYGTLITGTDGTAVGTGAQNTKAIVAGCTQAGIAAKIADDYSLNGYDDWFLPSRAELDLLYRQKDKVGNLTNDVYWSSSINTETTVFVEIFYSIPGFQTIADHADSYMLGVRAIRAF